MWPSCRRAGASRGAPARAAAPLRAKRLTTSGAPAGTGGALYTLGGSMRCCLRPVDHRPMQLHPRARGLHARARVRRPGPHFCGWLLERRLLLVPPGLRSVGPGASPAWYAVQSVPRLLTDRPGRQRPSRAGQADPRDWPVCGRAVLRVLLPLQQPDQAHPGLRTSRRWQLQCRPAGRS